MAVLVIVVVQGLLVQRLREPWLALAVAAFLVASLIPVALRVRTCARKPCCAALCRRLQSIGSHSTSHGCWRLPSAAPASRRRTAGIDRDGRLPRRRAPAAGCGTLSQPDMAVDPRMPTSSQRPACRPAFRPAGRRRAQCLLGLSMAGLWGVFDINVPKPLPVPAHEPPPPRLQSHRAGAGAAERGAVRLSLGRPRQGAGIHPIDRAMTHYCGARSGRLRAYFPARRC